MTETEIDITTALEQIEAVVEMRGNGADHQQHDSDSTEYAHDALLDAAGLLGCAERIENPDADWDRWNITGMTFWRASGGSEDGFAAFNLYSQKSASKYDAETTRARWKHYKTSKPTRIGAGSLVYWARLTDPKFQPREFFDDGREDDPEGEPGDGGDASERPHYRVYTLAEAVALPPVSWRVDGLFPERGKVCVAGAPGSGKGLVTIDLLMSVALGVSVRGEIPVHPGPVFYLAAEGWPGIPQRCNAWLAAHRIDTRLEDVPFTILPAAPQLNSSAADLTCLLNTIDMLPARPAVLVIDTLSRTLSGSDSDAKDMNPYLHALGRIQAFIDGLVIVLHHTGWNTSRERGFSGLRADMDTLLLLARDDLHIKVTCEKQKDAEEFAPLTYAIRSEGDSVWAAPVLQREKPTDPNELKGNRRKAFDILFRARHDGGLGFEDWLRTTGVARNTLNLVRQDLVLWGFIESKNKKWCVVARFFHE